MKVKIESAQVNTRSGKSANGRDWVMHEQEGILDGERIRGTIRIMVESPDKAYQPGEYEMDYERLFTIGRYQDLQLVRNLPLKPVKASGIFGKTGTNG